MTVPYEPLPLRAVVAETVAVQQFKCLGVTRVSVLEVEQPPQLRILCLVCGCYRVLAIATLRHQGRPQMLTDLARRPGVWADGNIRQPSALFHRSLEDKFPANASRKFFELCT